MHVIELANSSVEEEEEYASTNQVIEREYEIYQQMMDEPPIPPLLRFTMRCLLGCMVVIAMGIIIVIAGFS